VRSLRAVLLAAAGCAASDPMDEPFGPDGRSLREEIATYPEEQRQAFALLERRCTRCHTLNKPFAAHVPAGSWGGVVRRMARRPGAAIPPADAERIAAFLEYLADRRRR